jgi:hypothetical protein
MREAPEIALPWRFEDLRYDQIEIERVRQRDDIFFLLTASSFVEILSDLTTRNLVAYFGGDEEVGAWLTHHWEHEEVQHGRALREYVLRVWPEFDWDGTYARFFAEYSQLCTLEEFEATRCLEMAARCVVEMGTASYYRSLSDFAPEPFLKDLAHRIHTDEVRHYKHFLRYFSRYQEHESTRRLAVIGALHRRLGAVRSDDAEIALWHAFQSRHPDAEREGRPFRSMFSGITTQVKAHYPADMAVKMLLKPLALPPWAADAVASPLALVAQRWILR